MRRLFGGQKGAAVDSSSVPSSSPAKHHSQNGTPKKRRPFLPFLRSSLRKQPSTGKEEIGQNGGLLAPSRTFDVSSTSRSPHIFSPLGGDHTFYTSLSPGSSSACHSEENALRSSEGNSSSTDGQLDRSLMQTCTDVKYENRRRPKFTAVVDANFQRQCLQAHNHVRQLYGCCALSWSQELAELAKTWALKLAQRGRMLYPELPGIGENIFLLSADSEANGGGREKSPAAQQQQEMPKPTTTGDHLTTGTELVALWAAEAKQFDFGWPTWNQRCHHFTQMIWRGSSEMGVARHWNTANDCLAIVAFYRPAGNCNLPGEFAANLPSREEVPPEGLGLLLAASTPAALSLALNGRDIGDGGFRKSPIPPRSYSSPTNSTKILKC